VVGGPRLVGVIALIRFSTEKIFIHSQPMDYKAGVHRGFGFVEYEDADDASEAIFNMDGADLMGRTVRVSMAQMNQLNKLSTTTHQAIWSSDEWFQQNVAGQPNPEERAQLQAQAKDQQNLRD
jgi:peptidyl-prolyl isomerase E (cyclophilin E)